MRLQIFCMARNGRRIPLGARGGGRMKPGELTALPHQRPANPRANVRELQRPFDLFSASRNKRISKVAGSLPLEELGPVVAGALQAITIGCRPFAVAVF